MPTRPAAQQTQVLRETVSLAGRRVQLLQEQGSYQGARPYYTVAQLQSDGRLGRATRHTPFLERAEFLFERFAADVTDPARLR